MKILYHPLALGFALLALGFSICSTCGYALFDENVTDWLPCILVPMVLSFICLKCHQSQNKQPVFRRGILLTTGLLWFTTTLLGALPYLLVLNCSFSTSFFESVSGLTTTGASALTSVEDLPRSLLLWRSLSQWFGGLGFIVFFISFLGNTQPANKKLFVQESTFSSDAISLFSLRKNISDAFRIYLVLTVLCFLSLIYFKLPYFDAICHALTTVSTGGFSIYNEGIPHLHNLNIEIVLMIFMFLGGINFLFLTRIFSKSGPDIIFNREFRAHLLIMSLILMGVTASLVSHGRPFWNAFYDGLFQVISIGTTTGFHSCDFSLWLPLPITLLLILTFVGGCSGSTAGGFKVFRVVALFKIVLDHLEKVFHPNVVRSVRIDKVLWDDKKQLEILQFFTLTVGLILLGTLGLQIAMPQLDFLTAFSATIAGISNVGPGLTSSIGPCQTYAFFSSSAKFIFAILMLLGRLELYAIVALFSKKFWQKFE